MDIFGEHLGDIVIDFGENRYHLVEHLGTGANGSVYKGVCPDIHATRAIKFIKKSKLKDNWGNEIIRVNKLGNDDYVVKYFTHNIIRFDEEDYLWIMLEYVDGCSLSEVISKNDLDIVLLKNVIETVLKVMHNCKRHKIYHGDLHPGNILVEKYDEDSFEPLLRRIKITDFGCVSKSDKEILNDYKGLNRIIEVGIRNLKPATMDSESRYVYFYLRNKFTKMILETNPMQGEYVRDPKNLLKNLQETSQREGKSDLISKGVGDYLAAEHIGDRYEEWKSLFVPTVPALRDIIDRNITILTGLRGCGKTMLFRRLTEVFNIHLGHINLDGTESFLGFYLNARTIAEAFPWMPTEMESDARPQLINFFHLRWVIEILEWLRLEEKQRNSHRNANWVFSFFSKYYRTESFLITDELSGLTYLINYFNERIEETRLHSGYGRKQRWELSDIDFLDKFISELKEKCEFVGDRPIYLFLDDYSKPLIPDAQQKVLNAVIFIRRSNYFFKVSTENMQAFTPFGIHNKKLEPNADYKLVDLGSHVFSMPHVRVKEMIRELFGPRIERKEAFKKMDLKLEDILGDVSFSNNTLAEQINTGDETRVLYYGIDVFSYVWSSDIRELISIFTEMTQGIKDESLGKPEAGIPIIKPEYQDKILKEAGSRFLSQLKSTTNPNRPDVEVLEEYGDQLKRVVEAIKEIAFYELKNKTSKNGDRIGPKQARRIEIVDKIGVLNPFANDVYAGLIRYGVLIGDSRAKSVRGNFSARLYLRGVMIPYSRLTFRKRDSISLTWGDFESLLMTPEQFMNNYIERDKMRKKKGITEEQISMASWIEEDYNDPS